MADQYLLCRAHDGSLLNVAQILGRGIQLQGRIISLTKFQELLGSKACVTFTDGRLADFDAISAAITAAADSASNQQPLLEDENDEYCLICSLGGDLICCETCPATFHTECIGLSEVPLDDWFCPACRCSPPGTHTDAAATAAAENESNKGPTYPELIPCSNIFLHRLNNKYGENGTEEENSEGLELEKEGIDDDALVLGNGTEDGGLGSNQAKKRPVRSKLWSYRKLHLEEAGKPPPLYKVQIQQEQEQLPQEQEEEDAGKREDGGDDDHQMKKKKMNGGDSGGGSDIDGIKDSIANNSADIQQLPAPPITTALDNRIEEEEPKVTALEEEDLVSPGIRNREEYNCQRSLAECCAQGEIPLATVYAANKPIQISFQLINTAAAFSNLKPPIDSNFLPEGYNGINNKIEFSNSNCLVMPGYTEVQRSELRQVLSAALLLVQSAYLPLIDSRTGQEILPWLFSGKTFPSGCADYSTMHVAVLYVGSTVAGVACVRSLGKKVAEIPIFTIRPELRRNHLGEHFLSQLEKVLLQAGIELIITPAMILPGWPLTPSSDPREQQNLALPMQSRWGYTLATKEEMQKIAQVRPLAFPGVYTCVKWLSSSTQEKELAVEISLPEEEMALAAGKANEKSILTSTMSGRFGPNHAKSPLIPRSLPISLAIAPEINVQLLQNMGFIELRCDQGTSDLILVRPSPGFELVIKTSAEDFYDTANNNNYNNQGGSRGPRSTAGNGTATDRSMGSDQPPKQDQIDTLSPVSLQKATGKRKYTKRKEKGDAADAGALGSPKKSGGKLTKKQREKLELESAQIQKQHKQQQTDPTHAQILGFSHIPPFGDAGGALGASLGGNGVQPSNLPYDPSGAQLPPGAPVLRSLVHPNHPLLPMNYHQHPAVLAAPYTTVSETYAAVQLVQKEQAQRLAEMEDAILRKQASLMQGMALFAEQQQQLTLIQQQQQQQQQQQYSTNPGGYGTLNQNSGMVGTGGGVGGYPGYFGAGMQVHQHQQPQQLQSLYNNNQNGSAANLAGDGGGSGYFQQPQQQQQYFQQKFDELSPLQSVYESHHQQAQQQQQHFQNAAMAPPPSQAPQQQPQVLEPGYLYHLSSQPLHQQQQQPLNLFRPPQDPTPSYYYGNASHGGGG